MLAFGDGRDLEAETYLTQRIRLMIQIIVFLEILISCFLRLEMVCFIQWANQPRRTPRNRSPSGWRTEGKSSRLVEGMPNASSTGLKGERSQSRAERIAENFGLDVEMLQAADRVLIASD